MNLMCGFCDEKLVEGDGGFYCIQCGDVYCAKCAECDKHKIELEHGMLCGTCHRPDLGYEITSKQRREGCEVKGCPFRPVSE